MRNVYRINKLIRRINQGRYTFGPKRWSEEPNIRTCFNWCQQNISAKPQNLIGYILKMIDDEIQNQADIEIHATFDEMIATNPRQKKIPHEEAQAADWLGVSYANAGILFNPRDHEIEGPITSEKTINMLKNLIKNNDIDWETTDN